MNDGNYYPSLYKKKRNIIEKPIKVDEEAIKIPTNTLFDDLSCYKSNEVKDKSSENFITIFGFTKIETLEEIKITIKDEISDKFNILNYGNNWFTIKFNHEYSYLKATERFNCAIINDDMIGVYRNVKYNTLHNKPTKNGKSMIKRIFEYLFGYK
ncbi:hypothetical protein EDEG_00339 [Edhazardia aedis USNM 41457]|uniref:Uncharacterized protein n=1 Tax=Edhazardia aedis (strain USNM 41457) TaxID=1003232 RepID=J9DKE4_EDHAE|nr:hypothetical protein EDEG_00339 [Edhazardia aedis USNM 41457]|eukprot:EJW01852.1 hypothetical protein EDEG_00339 [Edhazardia aedis USNM 41457]